MQNHIWGNKSTNSAMLEKNLFSLTSTIKSLAVEKKCNQMFEPEYSLISALNIVYF